MPQIESILLRGFVQVSDGTGSDEDQIRKLTGASKQAKASGLSNDGLAAFRFRPVKGDAPVNLLDALVKVFSKEFADLPKRCIPDGDVLVNGR